MGTWGAGNFEDDVALDWLGVEVQTLLTKTIECELVDHDEGNGSVITAAIEVLTVICEHTAMIPPEPATVAKWRQMYLETWNGYIDDLDPKPGFKEERSRVIEATFARLAAISQKYHLRR